ncbi:MAG: histidine--tRNA ligase [Deltaproteobacteria bacterium]|nr:histidine--tRNA ligase [Deltaproteobacteria bacterium]MDL1960654.1 histidine--tRNA ligase [Deltaproteobacteria bacterium]
MPIRAVRGFKDVLPDEIELWYRVESLARDVFNAFGLKEIRIPLLEKTEVFARSIGELTDIVEKEMYTFIDRSGDSLTLRPEATAGLLRAVNEHKLFARSPVLKLFTTGPMFRHERPQKGRLRQFHQINVEVMGTKAPFSDTEVIWMAWDILEQLGPKDLRLEINSLGCPVCRPRYRDNLKLYLEGVFQDLCPDCQRRSKINPLRVFDCKHEACKKIMAGAPLNKEHLCPECADHLDKVLAFLKTLDIPFIINPYLVRGLDYYVMTTFEIVSPDLGAQSTVAAGGRYDGLLKALGGPDLPGVGMAIGVDRLLLLLEKDKKGPSIDIFIAALGPEARREVMSWIRHWRRQGLAVQISYEDRGLKAQMKQANRVGARYVLIVGENELDKKQVAVRDMITRDQHEVPVDDVISAVETLVR